ncbi:Ferritin [Paragonimus heterotremus]|uniref:Ferritin n=1 Tax=Paragonimus heterotremus TaxID=100268 RepID=A0A8J4WK39_9TREM|nr:Ferritin [Paragonimus heterotremus]
MHTTRVNYTEESELAVNKAIQLHQEAAHTYDHLAATCATEEISMPGFCKFFRLCSRRQRRLAEHWINYQTLRGGRVHILEVKPLEDIRDLHKQKIDSLVEIALEVEKKFEHHLHQLHRIALSTEDIALREYIEKKLTLPQLHVIRMMANHVNGLRVSGNYYLYDRTTMMALVKKLHRELTRREEGEYGERMCGSHIPPRTSTGVAAFIYPF